MPGEERTEIERNEMALNVTQVGVDKIVTTKIKSAVDALMPERITPSVLEEDKEGNKQEWVRTSVHVAKTGNPINSRHEIAVWYTMMEIMKDGKPLREHVVDLGHATYHTTTTPAGQSLQTFHNFLQSHQPLEHIAKGHILDDDIRFAGWDGSVNNHTGVDYLIAKTIKRMTQYLKQDLHMLEMQKATGN